MSNLLFSLERRVKLSAYLKLMALISVLKGRLRKNGDIKGIEYSDKLESFLMNFMPVDRKVSKKLSLLTWRYVEGESIEFPIYLISSSANATG